MKRTKTKMTNEEILNWLDNEYDIRIVLYPHIGKKNYIAYSILVCYDSNIYIIQNSIGGIVIETIHYSQYPDTHIFFSDITDKDTAIKIGIIFGMYMVEHKDRFHGITDYTEIIKIMESELAE